MRHLALNALISPKISRQENDDRQLARPWSIPFFWFFIAAVKFLLRSGQRPPVGVRPWTRHYLIWVAQLRFTQIAQEATRQGFLHEVEHMRERVARLEQAIMEAVKLASPSLHQVIDDLQALRGGDSSLIERSDMNLAYLPTCA